MTMQKFVVQTLAMSVALFALFGLGAKEAKANIVTEIDFTNNTTSTLTLVNFTGTSPQRFITTNPNYPGSSPVCAYSGPPATIGPIGSPTASGCFYAMGTNDFVGTGGTMTYAMVVPPTYPTNSPTQSLFHRSRSCGNGIARGLP